MKHLVKYPILMTSRQCENMFQMFLLFCWIKMLSKRYRFNRDSFKIMFLTIFSAFSDKSQRFSSFFDKSQRFFHLLSNFLMWHCKGIFDWNTQKLKFFVIVFKGFLYCKAFLFSEKSWFSWWTVLGALKSFVFLFFKRHT